MTLFIACFLTVVTETAFFYLLGRRGWAFTTVCVAVNAATNLSLNLLLGWMKAKGAEISLLVYPLELAVIFIEFGAYAALEGPSKKLFWQTAGANALRYGLGLVLFGHV